MIWVTDAKYLGEHRVVVTFNDGTSGVVDLHDTIFQDARELFRQLRDPEAFSRFRVAMDTIVWENGLDLAPEFLYEAARKAVSAEAPKPTPRETL